MSLLRESGNCQTVKEMGCMDLGLIQKLYDEGLCRFADGFADWKDAVAFAAGPLVDKGYIDDAYVDGVFRNVEKNGFYIFIAPHLCLPHCGEFEHVHRNCMSFMKCNHPVVYDKDEEDMAAELFFVLAGENAGSHIDGLQQLAMILEDEKIIEALLRVKNEEDLKVLLHENAVH